MELTVIKQTMPSIEFNKTEIKKWLTEELAKYQNLTVTDETLVDDKRLRAELNASKKRIDDFRKEVKNEISKPLKAFETDVKELLTLFDDVIGKLDAQLHIFEEQRKKEQEEKVLDFIKSVVDELGLDEKHAQQLTMSPEYLNKGAVTSKGELTGKVKTEIKNRAETLKMAQDAKVRDVQLILDTCNQYQDEMTLDVNTYLRLLEMNQPIGDIISGIHNAVLAEKQKKADAEKAKIENELAEQRKQMEEEMARKLAKKEAETKEPVVHQEPIKLSPKYTTNEKISHQIIVRGTEEQLDAFYKIIASIGVEWESVVEEELLWD